MKEGSLFRVGDQNMYSFISLDEYINICGHASPTHYTYQSAFQYFKALHEYLLIGNFLQDRWRNYHV